jgi:hypothetical protein
MHRRNVAAQRLSVLVSTLVTFAGAPAFAQPAAADPPATTAATAAERQAAFEKWWGRLLTLTDQSKFVPFDGFKVTWVSGGKSFDAEGRDITAPGYAGETSGVWSDGKLWRTHENGGIDGGFDGSTLWAMDLSTLSLFRENDEELPKDTAYDPRHQRFYVLESLRHFFGAYEIMLGGFQPGRKELAAPKIEPDGSWTLHYLSEEGRQRVRLDVFGGFDFEAGVGFINRARYQLDEGGQRKEAASAVYSDWKPSWIPGLWAAENVAFKWEHMRDDEFYRSLQWSPIDKKELKEVAAPPMPGRVDPVLGKIKIPEVSDYRASGWGPRGTHTTYDEDGEPVKQRK